MARNEAAEASRAVGENLVYCAEVVGFILSLASHVT